MTVSAETNKARYSGDGSPTSFSTVFTFASNDEVTVTKVVTATGLETKFTLGTEYTLTGAGTGSAVKRMVIDYGDLRQRIRAAREKD